VSGDSCAPASGAGSIETMQLRQRATASSPEAGGAQDLAGCRYAIVGGGISGLAAAWYLQQRGAQTHIIEREAELGGRVASGRLDDRIVTLGGKNIGRTYSRFRAFVASHGKHSYEPFGINSSRIVNGRLVRFDSSRRLRLLAEARRVPPFDALRLVRLARRLAREPEARHLSERTCSVLAERWGARTLDDLFGEHLCELILRSLTVRVSGAEPDEIPIANILPYLAMLLDTYEQLSDGMHRLIEEAGRRSRLSLDTEATGLILRSGRICGVNLRAPTGEMSSDGCDGVVVATTAHAAADLLEAPVPAASALLREVRYFPLAVVLAEYEQPVFAPDVRAIVFGPEQALSNAGAYGVDDLNVVRYTFSGRAARSLLDATADVKRLISAGEHLLAAHANLQGNPRRSMVTRRFVPGLCAYHADQTGMLAGLRAAITPVAGLGLTGDYLSGCSIEACFAAAQGAVGRAF